MKRIWIVSGAALLALATTASAAPASVVGPQIIAARTPTAEAAYCYDGYGLGYFGYSAPVVSGPSLAADGIYCATSVKTCLLKEPGWLGTGCSCRVPGGYARGVVE